VMTEAQWPQVMSGTAISITMVLLVDG
jgi:hypothetical protein